MGEWLPIKTYPREPVQYGAEAVDTCEWGPEALLLMPPCDVYPHEAVAVVGHLEADMWLSRDAGDPCAWGSLAVAPTHWMPLPTAPALPPGDQTHG